MNKLKKQIALVLIFCMVFCSFSTGTKTSAHENDYDANLEEGTIIKNYITFENNQFIINSEKMFEDGIDKKYVEQLCKDYKEINQILSTSDLEQIESEKQEMLEEIGPTEKGKLSAAVKVIKKFLKEK